MVLYPATPFGEMTSLRDAMNRLFEESVVRPGTEIRTIPLDVYETADDLVVVAALPGVSPNDLTVTATADTLTITACVSSEMDKPEASRYTWYLHEIRHGQYSRTIDLPVEIDPQKARAIYHNGMLRLELPKVEGARQHQLKIETESPQGQGQKMMVGQGQAAKEAKA
jgi:HSP20 family protein